MSSRPELKLDWCSHEAAKYAVEKWHYARVMPRFKTVKVGAWEDGRFVGCLVFADGANNNMLKPYGLDYHEGCELVRVALATHATPVTRLVSIALRFLKREFASMRLVLSYADPEQGHHGGIYQGGNWVYVGRTGVSDEYIVNGRRMHGKALRQTRASHRLKEASAANALEWARKVLDPKAVKVDGSSKYRYLMPLDDEMRKRIEPLRKPYPKRAGGVAGDTSANHAGEGGSIPTPALSPAITSDV